MIWATYCILVLILSQFFHMMILMLNILQKNDSEIQYFLCMLQLRPPTQRQSSFTHCTTRWTTPRCTWTKKSVFSTPSMITLDSKSRLNESCTFVLCITQFSWRSLTWAKKSVFLTPSMITLTVSQDWCTVVVWMLSLVGPVLPEQRSQRPQLHLQ